MEEPRSVPLEVLLEDGPLLAVNKPGGLLTLGAIPGVPTLERQVKAYLRQKYDKPGNVYLGIPHRLDRPVSGVVVFARNSKAAARLAEQFRERQVRKLYWAVVDRAPERSTGELVDWLQKAPEQAKVSVVAEETPGAREARLTYRTLDADLSISPANDDSGDIARCSSTPAPALLEIELHTGRMHQIRVQLASRGWPVVGDAQYGSAMRLAAEPCCDPRDEPIALHARSLTVLHPIRYDAVTIEAPLPASWRRLVPLLPNACNQRSEVQADEASGNGLPAGVQ